MNKGGIKRVIKEERRETNSKSRLKFTTPFTNRRTDVTKQIESDNTVYRRRSEAISNWNACTFLMGNNSTTASTIKDPQSHSHSTYSRTMTANVVEH